MIGKRVLAIAVGIMVAGCVMCVLLFLPRSSAPGSNGATLRDPASTFGETSSSTLRRDIQRDSTTNTTVESELPVGVSASTSASVATARIAMPAGVSIPPADPDPSGLPPETVMENVRSVFRLYASRFGGNPVGTNPEITAALQGGNSGQVQFVQAEDGLRVNSNGELIDSWGVPFFFHQLSGTEMEIHSAGPDRVMWTTDDLVIR